MGKENKDNFYTLILDPPPKVQQMYRAVMELLSGGQSPVSLKVGDIALQAGIGKGTIYEYFSSKEDLISNAFLYEFHRCFDEIRKNIGAEKSFPDKIARIFVWFTNAGQEHPQPAKLLQMINDSVSLCSSLREKFRMENLEELKAEMIAQVDTLMRQGAEEGHFTEENPEKRRLAFFGMLVEYLLSRSMFFVADKEPLHLEEEEARHFAYAGMVRALKQ